MKLLDIGIPITVDQWTKERQVLLQIQHLKNEKNK
jgi:hypothetical protein